jgi:ferrous iron transport protein A
MDSCVDWYTVDEVRPLASLVKGDRGIVSSVGDAAGSMIARRLLEIGFIPGERVEVIAEIQPGGDPIAVRIGASMFALRRREAQAVLVRRERPEAV